VSAKPTLEEAAGGAARMGRRSRDLFEREPRRDRLLLLACVGSPGEQMLPRRQRTHALGGGAEPAT